MCQITPIISVIIPCYKGAAFLPAIVACLEKQTFQDFEIILVNDGDDGQLPIMQQLQSNNAKIRIINKKNGGLSSARNAGMNAAEGEWIVFMDQDDEVKPYYLQSLYDAVVNNHVDIAIGGFQQYYVRERRYRNYFIEPLVKSVYSYQEVFELIGGYTLYNVWNKIFNTNLLKKNHFHFSDYYFTGDDEVFWSDIILKVNPNIALINDCGYIYLMRDNESISSKYVPTYVETRTLVMSSRKQILDQFSWDENRKNAFLSHSYYMMGYFICCNYFKKGTPLSFSQQVKCIRTELLQNKEILNANNIHIYGGGNLFMKIYNVCMRTHSAFVIALAFRLQYWCKYHLYGLYLKIVPYLRGVKK